MQAHALFPTLIVEETFSNHNEFKKIFEKNVLSYFNDEGVSFELTKNDLHHDSSLNQLYVFATKVAKSYVSTMLLDPEIFDYYIPKSWLNVVGSQITPTHNHGEVSLSFVYYVNIPKGKENKITFYDENEKRELFANCVRMLQPKEWNIFNSLGWSFTPQEGNMFVFPGKLNHGTEGVAGVIDQHVHSFSDYRSKRVAIAGDVVLVYKKPTLKYMGHQPLSQWRTFG